MCLTDERRIQIRERITKPFRDLSEIYATYETNQTTGSYVGDRKTLGPYQRPGGIAELRRLATIRRMDNARDATRRRKQEEFEKRRDTARSEIIRDFLNHELIKDLAKKYKVGMKIVARMIREGVSEEDRHRVWCFHQSKRVSKAWKTRKGTVAA